MTVFLTIVISIITTSLLGLHFKTVFLKDGVDAAVMQGAAIGGFFGFLLLAKNLLETIFPNTPQKISLFILALYMLCAILFLMMARSLKSKES